MTLRDKTLTIVVVTLAGSMMMLYATSRIILLSSFADLEEQHTHQDMQRVLTALADELSVLDNMVSDWAARNDTYHFIQDDNEAYIQSNLVDKTFIDPRLNLIMYLNTSGQIVYGKGFDLAKAEEVPISQEVRDYITDDKLLLSHSDPQSYIKGIVFLPTGPMLVASRPILTSEEKGPIQGTLIMGRHLDSATVDHLAKKTHLSLNAYQLDDPQKPADVQKAGAFLSKEQPIYVHSLDDTDTIAGYALVEDIHGKPALALRIDMPREIYKQGKVSLFYYALSLTVVGLIFSAAMMWLLERSVLSRLFQIGENLKSIGDSGDLARRVQVTGKDELADLGDTINGMLKKLEKIQRELRQSEARYRMLSELTSDFASSIRVESDSTLVVEWMTESFTRMTGLTPGALNLPDDLNKFVYPDDLPVLLDRYKAGLSGQAYETEYRILTKGGEMRWLRDYALPIWNEGQNRVVHLYGAAQDITERKQAEEELSKHREHLEELVSERTTELRERMAEIEQLNRTMSNLLEDLQAANHTLEETATKLKEANRELENFAYVASHDLKAPLRAIIQLADWLSADYGEVLDEDGQEILKLLIDRTKRMHNLIEGILQYSRIGRVAERRRNANLNRLVEDTIKMLAPPEHIQITIENKLPTVKGDRTRLGQVFQNLLSNAIKFIDKPQGQTRISYMDEGSHWQFSVADNGPGIEKKYYNKIFQMFQTLKPRDKFESTGVGLALVKKIVETWGGEVWVESAVGQGSTFFFTLPKNEEDNEKH
jgi:PAS domain S-box-containing protein